jgi:hypothetical protein
MANLGTITERIKNELPRNTSLEITRIRLGLISAMEYYKHHRFFFNEATDTFETVQGQDSYTRGTGTNNYPDDLVYVDTLFVDVTNTWTEVYQVTLDRLRDEFVSENTEGYPYYWSWHHESILLVPTPHLAFDVRLDYVKQLDTPTANFTGSVWEFTEGDGTTSLTDSYENDWLTHAEELIRLHTKIDLYQNLYKDNEDVIRLENRLRSVYGNLKSESNFNQATMTRTPYI